ncbi:MAG: hypothetical protein HQ538_00485 [Parcubacteria group bacterium]|nr:hypothetical protein [Parcubacteria group bacterium]
MISSFIKSILVFFLVLGGLEYISYDKTRVYLVSALLLTVAFIISISFVRKGRIQSDRIAFALFPILFLASLVGFFVFIPGDMFRHIFAVIGSLVYALLTFYTGNLAAKRVTLDSKNKYYSLGEISILVYAFFSYSCIFGFYLFLNLPTWILMLQTLLISVFVAYFHFCYNKIKLSQNFIFYSIYGLISCEIAWALSFWPTGFISRGMVLFIVFYVFAGLIKNYFNKTLDKKVVREHLVVAFVSLAIILSTTKWTF